MFDSNAFGNLGARKRGGKKRKKTSRKRKTAHQARFSRAAKQCKGLSKREFQSCMRTEMTPMSLGRRRRRK